MQLDKPPILRRLSGHARWAEHEKLHRLSLFDSKSQVSFLLGSRCWLSQGVFGEVFLPVLRCVFKPSASAISFTQRKRVDVAAFWHNTSFRSKFLSFCWCVSVHVVEFVCLDMGGDGCS